MNEFPKNNNTNDFPKNNNTNEIKIENKFEASLDIIGEWKWLKLFFVGDAGAGKTSVCRWLIGQEFDSQPSKTDSADVITTEVRHCSRVEVDIRELIADVLVRQTNRTFSSAEAIPSIDLILKEEHHPVSSSVLTPEFLENIDAYQKRLLEFERPLTFQIWEFAGQEVYYNTHHLFLTEAAIYLLIVDLTRSVEQIRDRTKFWLGSVRSYAPNAPILIIGTHEDLLSESQYEQKMLTIYTEYSLVDSNAYTGNCFAVSCKIPDEALRTETRNYLKVLAQQVIEQFNLKFPVRWMLLYHTMEKEARSSGNNHNNNGASLTCLDLKQAMFLASQCGMKDEELLEALKLFHKLGFVFYYASSASLNQTIFMKPQELVDALRTVITIKTQIHGSIELIKEIFRPGIKLPPSWEAEQDEKLLKQGILTVQRMKKIWSHYPPNVHNQLRVLLQQFELAIPDPSSDKPEEERDFLVPCMVEQAPQPDQDKSLFPFVFVYQLDVVPPLGILSRLMVKALQLAKRSHGRVFCKLFRQGCTFFTDGLHARLNIRTDKVKIRMQKEDDKDKIVSFLDDLDQFYQQEIGKFSRLAKCINCNKYFQTQMWGFYCSHCADNSNQAKRQKT